jgi:hypothetical protein
MRRAQTRPAGYSWLTGEAGFADLQAADEFFNAARLVFLVDVRGRDCPLFVNAQKPGFVWRRKLILRVDVSPQRVDFCAPHGGSIFMQVLFQNRFGNYRSG